LEKKFGEGFVVMKKRRELTSHTYTSEEDETAENRNFLQGDEKK